MEQNFSFDKTSFIIDGVRQFLVGGEIHYFRVPRADWDRRMALLAEAGANAVSTYVPWCVHEREEGRIDFSEKEECDLPGFLKVAAKYGLKVFLRPGPYQYSELFLEGLPKWLCDRYPEIQAKRADGSAFGRGICSYLHPIFLEKTRTYYHAFCNAIRPYSAENGGPVVMIQLDNELGGLHLWRGSADYNSESMGFGRADGRYPRYLEQRFESVKALNERYGTAYERFADVIPYASGDNAQAVLVNQDYFDFYCASLTEYASVLEGYLKECGINLPTYHNVAGPPMIPMFDNFNRTLGKEFLLSMDSYYFLNYGANNFSVSPASIPSYQFGADLLETLGNPYSVMELQGGTYATIPPVLPEDLEAFYMTHLAVGLKGVNYYVFTGGKNSEEFENSACVYDYSACVSADGKKRPTYRAVKRFSHLLRDNAWLAATEREFSVQLGCEFGMLREEFGGHGMDCGFRNNLSKCVDLTLMSTRFAGKFTELSGTLDSAKPLVLYESYAMSRAAQERVIAFVKNGGRILVLGRIPTHDEHYAPCTLLRDFLGVQTVAAERDLPYIWVNGRKVFDIAYSEAIESCCPGDEVIASDASRTQHLGIYGKRGSGSVLYFTGTWQLITFEQSVMLESFLNRLNTMPILACSNRCVNYTVRQSEDGRRAVFLMNLYSGVQKTDATLFLADKQIHLGSFTLKAKEVKLLTVDRDGHGFREEK